MAELRCSERPRPETRSTEMMMDFRQFAAENARAEFPARKTVCAWCAALLQAGPAAPVSRSMCQNCSTQLLDKAEEPRR